MTRFGYTLMCEHAGPRELVRDAVRAERAGFDFEVISDHYFPWLDSQGHSPNAWVTLGALAQATERIELMTYVTCPTMRYHPAVVAQQAAKLWDIGEQPPRIGMATSGVQSATLAGELADFLIAVQPQAELGAQFDAAGGAGKPRVGQVPISWDRSPDTAVQRAHEQFRWFGGGWKVNSELPSTAAFAGASKFVTPDDVAESIPCGPDVEAHVKAVRSFVDAGFTDVAVVQIGGDSQPEFLEWAVREVVPALREI